jgi:hypothetical protein
VLMISSSVKRMTNLTKMLYGSFFSWFTQQTINNLEKYWSSMTPRSYVIITSNLFKWCRVCVRVQGQHFSTSYSIGRSKGNSSQSAWIQWYSKVSYHVQSCLLGYNAV